MTVLSHPPTFFSAAAHGPTAPTMSSFSSVSFMRIVLRIAEQRRAIVPCFSTPPGMRNSRRRRLVVRSSSGAADGGSLVSRWEKWLKPAGKQIAAPSSSDVVWPSAGAFLAMALLAKLDQMVAAKGISFTIAPLGAVCAVLFATPNAPAARKYNVFVAQIGCAAIGVVALAIFGPGWLARATALATSIAFMIVTQSTHPPAASLPILFIDAAKLHHLHLWYALFPGATSCVLLCLIQEMVNYLKSNCKF